MTEPEWIAYGRTYIGQREIPGRDSNPWIRSLWFKLKGGWLWVSGGEDDSAVPWCGTYCAVCISESGLPLPKHWYRARDWLNWGVTLVAPELGCIVVFERKGGGHVGFVVGQDQNGNLMVLGGNQANRCSVAPFDRQRVLGYRWPAGIVIRIGQLPVIESVARVSDNEA